MSKAEVNRSLRNGPLAGRSAASVEYRMQNLSTFFDQKGLPMVAGYLPAKNVGRGVIERLDQILASLGDADAYALSADVAEVNERARRLRASSTRVPLGSSQPPSRPTTTTSFVRSPAVVAYVLGQAAGRCEGCGEKAPFLAAGGQPYLEVHHVKPLSKGGPDTVDNAVAVCPNCHRAFHHATDRVARTAATLRRVSRLRGY